MNKVIFFLFYFCCTFGYILASPIVDLYSLHNVNYDYECRENKLLGFYRSSEDKIHLRPFENYQESYLFNHTALHELSHWARHDSRLGAVRGPSYMEEIMSDFVAAIIADEMGIKREKNRAIGDYIDLQLSDHKVSDQTWKSVYTDLHQTVEFLLQRPYPKEKIKGYFKDFNAVSQAQLKRIT